MNNSIKSLEAFLSKIELNEYSSVLVFTGAGMSAESGLSTFRDSGGLWDSFKIDEVASIDAWFKNPKLVLDFYNVRRKQLLEVAPNAGHLALAQLQSFYLNCQVVTQNVDDLHERAGQKNVLHLHGKLLEARSTSPSQEIYPLKADEEINWGDLCPKGYQLRPNIVWFGEAVPAFEEAIQIAQECDLLIVVGSSLSVYPAASLLNFVGPEVPILLIDPSLPDFSANNAIYHYPETAARGLDQLLRLLIP